MTLVYIIKQNKFLVVVHKRKDTTYILHIKLGHISYFISVMNIQICKRKLFLRIPIF